VKSGGEGKPGIRKSGVCLNQGCENREGEQMKIKLKKENRAPGQGKKKTAKKGGNRLGKG